MAVAIERVITKGQAKEFVKVPFALYRGDANWVPQLISDDLKKFDRTRHPFWQHAAGELFMARRDGKPVGRIVAIHDELWEKCYGEKAAYWGWFECADDQEAAQALFDAARAWARDRGCTRMIGPMSPSANDLVGTLIEGFDGPPVLLMTYNQRYHDRLVQACGNAPWKDLVAWLLDSPEIPARLEKIMPRVEAKGAFTIRKLNMKDFKNELARFAKLYNEFEKVNAIYTPMTGAEIEAMANDLKMFVDPDIIFFAEVDGQVVGASLALPDLNVGLRAARGRLFPLGLLKVLAARKNIHLVRVMSMGVLKDFRNRGIDLAFYYYSYKYGVPKGYHAAEMSWVEKDNAAMTNTAIKLGGKAYRTYRVYEHALKA
jgi:GNAT superfamily N-acetyltransferase